MQEMKRSLRGQVARNFTQGILKASRSYTLTHVCWFSGLMASVAVSKGQ